MGQLAPIPHLENGGVKSGIRCLPDTARLSPSQRGMAALAVRQSLSDCGRHNGNTARRLSDRRHGPGGTVDMRRGQGGGGSRGGWAHAQASRGGRKYSERLATSYGLLYPIYFPRRGHGRWSRNRLYIGISVKPVRSIPAWVPYWAYQKGCV